MPETSSRRLAAAAAVIAVALAIVAAASPAGAQTASHGDVPSDAYYAEPVASLHLQGVFDGTLCEEGFCPSAPMDRKTMSVWTVRVLDGRDPPPITRSRFQDVDANDFHAPFVERMADLGVTAGCGDGTNFCPDRSVTRAQMAVFLSRAFDLPVGADPGFSDTPSDAWYAAHVASLAASGITAGCQGGAMFCPDDSTTRAQMATFLWRGISGSIDFGQYIDVMLEPQTPAPLRSVDFAKESGARTVSVHYCGRSGTLSQDQLEVISQDLTRTVGGFFRVQSGNDSNGEPRRAYDFVAGEVVSPIIDWTKPILSYWLKKDANDLRTTKHLTEDRCEADIFQAIRRTENNGGLTDADLRIRPMLIFVGAPGGGGYAYLSQSSGLSYVSMSSPPTIDRSTSAHEIGHALEGLRHPWRVYPQLCLEMNRIATERGSLRSRMIAKQGEDYCNQNAKDQGLPQWRVQHMLGSIMSYMSFGSEKSLGVDGNGPAYVACFQKAKLGWGVEEEDCEREGDSPIATVPTSPDAPNLTPGTETLVVDWEQPDSNGSPITDYVVEYRRSGADDGWNDWHHNGTATATTIDGLRSETSYHVRVQAVNAIGPSQWSPLAEATTFDDNVPVPRVILEIGDRVQGRSDCTSSACRWLHVTIENFGPGPHTLACAHNGVEALGFPRGVWHYTEIAHGDRTANQSCYFGYPGSDVFVIVGAEYRGGAWHGGYHSNIVEWQEPGSEPPQPPTGAVVNDDPELYDDVGTYNWWIPPGDINSTGYGANGFHFTLAAGRSNTVDSWARWDFGSVDGRYEIQAHIPSRWATAHVQYRIFVDGRQIAGLWIDQDAASGGWATLGAHDLRGQLLIEVLDSAALDDYRDHGPEATRIAADAIRLLPATDQPPTAPNPTLTVRRGSLYPGTSSRWVVGSGSNWPAGEQFWIKCGNFVDTSQNIPVPYRARYVDGNGNLSWGERICYSNSSHTVEVWTQSGARQTVTIGAP